MGFGLVGDHHKFFKERGWIEFQDLVPTEKLAAVQRGKGSTEALFIGGHDLWRRHDAVAKLVCRKELSETASSLFETKPLRLAYDQFLPADRGAPIYCLPLCAPGATLTNTSSLQGVVGGLLLRFSDGAGIFLGPHAMAPLDTAQDYLLIVYAQRTTLYWPEPADPHAHGLKRLGYVFGDRLSDEFHPILVW